MWVLLGAAIVLTMWGEGVRRRYEAGTRREKISIGRGIWGVRGGDCKENVQENRKFGDVKKRGRGRVKWHYG